jgi:hypothetical protein
VSPDDPEDDPGWKPTPRMFLFILPGYLRFHHRPRAGEPVDGLETIRQVWLSFVSGAVLFAVVVLVVVPGTETKPLGGWIAGLAIVTLACVVALDVVGRRELVGADLAGLALSFRTRFFLLAALAEAIALFAFVATFVTGVWWVYWLFLPFTLYGYARAAPTAGHLRDEQQRLRDRGSSLSLVAALRGTPPA